MIQVYIVPKENILGESRLIGQVEDDYTFSDCYKWIEDNIHFTCKLKEFNLIVEDENTYIDYGVGTSYMMIDKEF